MRFVPLVLAIILPVAASAQDQERKLVDRLLNPDKTLQNSEQSKQFVSDGNVRTKPVNPKSFYVSDRNLTKTFAGDRQFGTTSFQSHNYKTKAAYLPSATQLKTFATKDARNISASPASNKKYASREFAGNRPFLEQGKSQKALHQQDHPLSIDEVRELLNKNK